MVPRQGVGTLFAATAARHRRVLARGVRCSSSSSSSSSASDGAKDAHSANISRVGGGRSKKANIDKRTTSEGPCTAGLTQENAFCPSKNPFCRAPKAPLSGLGTLGSAHDSHGFSQDLLSPPEPFKVISEPDSKDLVLHRKFGVEEIEITCVFHDQTVGDNDGEEGFGPPPPPDVPMKMVQMTVKISLGSNRPFLEIVCCQFGTKASIEQVLLRHNVVRRKEAPYEGPDISMLSEKMKSGFVEFLEARGIDNEFGKFLLEFVPQTIQQKHVSWREKVITFLKM